MRSEGTYGSLPNSPNLKGSGECVNLDPLAIRELQNLRAMSLNIDNLMHSLKTTWANFASSQIKRAGLAKWLKVTGVAVRGDEVVIVLRMRGLGEEKHEGGKR